MTTDPPYVTIVIAIRNVGDDLKITLDSIESQGSRDFEVLIADCNSDDRPEKFLTGRNFPIQHIVETDSGIYDSWNKVLPRALGEWVIFFGAGDSFAGPDALEDSMASLRKMPAEALIAYGIENIIGENGKVIQQDGAPWPITRQNIAGFGIFPHQATFQRVSSFAKVGFFSTEYKVAGDCDMYFRVEKLRPPVHFGVVVANFRYGGKSSNYRSRSLGLNERRAILLKYGVAHTVLTMRIKLLALSFASRLLPEQTTRFLIDRFRVATGRKRRYYS